MKILIIHSHYQLHGGEDAVVEQEVKLLKEKHTVEVLYFQNQGGWRGALQFLVSIWNTTAATQVKNKIKVFQPDVVHIHNWHFALGPLVFRTINKLGISVVHTVHNYRLLCPSGILLHQGKLFTDSLKQAFPWKAVQNKVYRSSVLLTFWLAFIVWFHKKIGTWKKVNSYVCLTPFAVDLFQESNFGIPKEQFSVKPNFKSVARNLNIVARENHFLFIGRLSEEKGIATLLNAFKDMPYSLKMAGDGPLKNEVVQVAKEYNNITYLGNLSSAEVVTELRKTQALIFPSVWYEGMPMTVLEALSASTPIIASNLGAMTSLVTDTYNGFHFEAGDFKDLQKQVIRFDSLSEEEKNQMRANAFDTYTLHYSPELQLDYFDSIYNKFLRKI
ncbi:glycosyltransferase [Flavobacterium eburneipallidum]|uniref:glycosyltransferase n=1 Tax=Flavobacterium eburneipallidum TaxID=3003263 RepID=UPI00248304A7|nr:glycosyltransferase [Flavobacterium eburneipallidum]